MSPTVKRYLCVDCGEPTNGARCCPCAIRNWNRSAKGRETHARRAVESQRASLPRAAELAVLYHGGCTLQEIGDAIGVSRERVRQLLHKIGADRKPKGWSEESLSRPSGRLRTAAGLSRDEALYRQACTINAWIDGIRLLALRLKRTPSLTDLAEWRGFRHASRVHGSMRSALGYKAHTAASASHEVYRMAGFEPYRTGCPGVSKRIFRR